LTTVISRCFPLKISTALRHLDSVEIMKQPSLADPILQISYIPDPPRSTIRQIMRSIQAVDGRWHVSIVHPPSLEERARQMQIREQRQLLLRITLTFIIAIPTFLVGVVFMSLVNSENAVRTYLEEEMWAGRASRFEWALFILSTPVMFFAADIFHRRSFEEIVTLWRRGSRTPIYRRFIRFGSMNLLASPPLIRSENSTNRNPGISRCFYCLLFIDRPFSNRRYSPTS
jgi:cation transport ATPase